MNDSHETQLSAACLLLSVAEADEILDECVFIPCKSWVNNSFLGWKHVEPNLKRYVFSYPINEISFVVFPIAVGKIPSANGSNVPAWPILYRLNFFFIFRIALKELIFIGLYILSQP